MQKDEREIRYFFRHLMLYGVANLVFIFIWFLMGMNYFWPVWSIVFWGIPLFVEAVRLKALPGRYQQPAEQAFNKMPEITEAYEDRFVKHVTESGVESKVQASKPKAAVKKSEPKKAAPKKAPAKVSSKKSAPVKKVAKPVQKKADK